MLRARTALPHTQRSPLTHPSLAGPHLVCNAISVLARFDASADALCDEQVAHVQGGPTGRLRRAALQGYRRVRGPVPDRHLRTAHLRLPSWRVARWLAAAHPLRGILHLLPQGGGFARPRSARHLPSPPGVGLPVVGREREGHKGGHRRRAQDFGSGGGPGAPSLGCRSASPAGRKHCCLYGDVPGARWQPCQWRRSSCATQQQERPIFASSSASLGRSAPT